MQDRRSQIASHLRSRSESITASPRVDPAMRDLVTIPLVASNHPGAWATLAAD